MIGSSIKIMKVPERLLSKLPLQTVSYPSRLAGQ